MGKYTASMTLIALGWLTTLVMGAAALMMFLPR
jgi:hypothetical protein